MLQPNARGFIKNALYLSHTSISDFLNCPRAYYLKNIYKDPITNHKLQVASPYLTLGSTVHKAIDWYCKQDPKPTKEKLLTYYRTQWKQYRLKRGGFSSLEEEASFGKRGLQMLENFYDHSLVLEPCAPSMVFPKYLLLSDVVLVGNLDYVGVKKDGTLHVIDFKTGSRDQTSALQLSIYAILGESNLGKEVTTASFWYLDREDLPRAVTLDPIQTTLDWLVEKAKVIKSAVAKNEWQCKRYPGLCKDCREYQALLDKKGEFLFSDEEYKKDFFFLEDSFGMDLVEVDLS